MKILIVGIVASGKSTFARKLSNKLDIRHYEIDSIVHDDIKKTKRTVEEQLNIINEINKNSDWIIEGTLREKLDILLELSDLIIWIHPPLYLRKIRIVLRYIKQKIGVEKSTYNPDIKMLKAMFKWTREFDEKKFMDRLYNYKEKLKILKTKKEIKELLNKEVI